MSEHIHRLKRHKYKNGTAVYFCSLNCPYKVEVPLALGKVVLCNICDNSFTMSEYSIKLARPHCVSCGKIQIKDTNGKRKFINKSEANPIAAIVAEKSIATLRQRLGTVVTMDKQPDEDI